MYQEVVQEDALSQKVNALLGVKPVIQAEKVEGKKLKNEDSFSNLQAAFEPVKNEGMDLKVSMIQVTDEGSSFFQNKSSFVFDHDNLQPLNSEGLDEYEDDDDPGFDTFVVNEENFVSSC